MACESLCEKRLTALEFYSGIGGMHYALQQAVPGASVLAAFDINEVANLVYKHNFGIKPRQGNVEKVDVARLDKYGADVWLLAPPCQPFTRQGHQRDLGDNRTRSFQRLLSHLAAMQKPPTWLLLENVVGFERSEAREALLDVLGGLGYTWQEFQLSPQQYGLPYSRPRYFCCATRDPAGLSVQLPGMTAPCCCPPYRLLQLVEQGAEQQQLLQEASQPTALRPVRPIRCYLQQHPGEEAEVAIKQAPAPWHEAVMAAAQARRAQRRQQVEPDHLPAHILQHQQQQQQQDASSQLAAPSQPGAAAAAAAEGRFCQDADEQHRMDSDTAAAVEDPWASFLVPHEVLEDCGDVIDVVTGDSTRAMCFTKGYSRNAKGSGSLVTTVPLGAPGADPGWYLVDGVHCMHRVFTGAGSKKDVSTNRAVRLALAEAWATLAPRYITPREVANLHSFPPAPGFTFPASVTRRQRYQLLGNSLSVEVVADLLKYMVGQAHGAGDGVHGQHEEAAAAAAAAGAGPGDSAAGQATAREWSPNGGQVLVVR